MLKTTITERHAAEFEAFKKFAAIYDYDDGETYRPSPGLVRLMARRRQLLDLEFSDHHHRVSDPC